MSGSDIFSFKQGSSVVFCLSNVRMILSHLTFADEHCMSLHAIAFTGSATNASLVEAPASFPKPRSRACQYLSSMSSIWHWAQTAALVAAITATIFLSFFGYLPATLFPAAMISLGSIACMRVADETIGRFLPYKNIKKSQGTYGDEIAILPPVVPCVLIPIIEEGIYRFFLQRNLQTLLSSYLPLVTFSLLGYPMILPALAAIISAGIFFGTLHAFNDHKHAYRQAFACALCGFSLGFLFSSFGLWASCLMHIINNTLAIFESELFGKKNLWTIRDLEANAAARLGPMNRKFCLLFPISYQGFVSRMQKVAREKKIKNPKLVIAIQYSDRACARKTGDLDRPYPIANKQVWARINSWWKGYYFNCRKAPGVFVIDGDRYRIPTITALSF